MKKVSIESKLEEKITTALKMFERRLKIILISEIKDLSAQEIQSLQQTELDFSSVYIIISS